MVAMTIFGMVMVAIYSSWSAILRGSKVGLNAAAEAQRSRIAVRAIRDALTSAQLYIENVRYYWFMADTSGDFAALSLVSRLPSFLSRERSFWRADRSPCLIHRRAGTGRPAAARPAANTVARAARYRADALHDHSRPQREPVCPGILEHEHTGMGSRVALDKSAAEARAVRGEHRAAQPPAQPSGYGDGKCAGQFDGNSQNLAGASDSARVWGRPGWRRGPKMRIAAPVKRDVERDCA